MRPQGGKQHSGKPSGHSARLTVQLWSGHSRPWDLHLDNKDSAQHHFQFSCSLSFFPASSSDQHRHFWRRGFQQHEDLCVYRNVSELRLWRVFFNPSLEWLLKTILRDWRLAGNKIIAFTDNPALVLYLLFSKAGSFLSFICLLFAPGPLVQTRCHAEKPKCRTDKS